MSAPKLLGTNLLETATSVTTTTIDAASSAARLYDRGRAPLCTASAAAQWDIIVNLGATPSAVTDFALINHNFGVAGITLDSSPDNITYTPRDTFTGVSGTDIFRTISTQSIQYWRIRVPAFASAPAIGEFFLGSAISLTNEPAYSPAPVDGVSGAVASEHSIGNFDWGIRLGSSKRVFQWTWTLLPDADWLNLLIWFAAIAEGAKAFAMLDVDGTARWVRYSGSSLQGTRVLKTGASAFIRSVQLSFAEAL